MRTPSLDIWTAVPQVRSFVGGLLQGAGNTVPVDPKDLYLGVLAAIGRTCDLSERAQVGHSERIADLATRTARAVGLDEASAQTAYLAGLLHDTGMAGIPDSVLMKAGALSRSDMSEIWGHPAISFANCVLLTTPGLKRRRRRSRKPASPLPKEIPNVMFPDLPWIVRWHHEKPDGSGYPDLIRGDEMPQTAQIVSLCDAFVSMREDRPYRGKMSADRAADRVMSQAGDQSAEVGRAVISQKAAVSSKPPEISFPGAEPSRETITSLVCSFAAIADCKHKSRRGHSRRLAAVCAHAAKKLSLTPSEQHRAFLSGLLCDVGMVHVPSTTVDSKHRILRPAKGELARHPVATKRILSAAPGFEEVADVSLAHHESFDGSGYPQGIYSDQIPILSQLVSICDAFVALTSDRPYRPALSDDAALREIKKGAGTRYSPKLAKEVTKAIKNTSEALAEAA
jgi:HD-GYP domain-containing protein (c-di-GMP phosphodiesterase class II)